MGLCIGRACCGGHSSAGVSLEDKKVSECAWNIPELYFFVCIILCFHCAEKGLDGFCSKNAGLCNALWFSVLWILAHSAIFHLCPRSSFLLCKRLLLTPQDRAFRMLRQCFLCAEIGVWRADLLLVVLWKAINGGENVCILMRNHYKNSIEMAVKKVSYDGLFISSMILSWFPRIMSGTMDIRFWKVSMLQSDTL